MNDTTTQNTVASRFPENRARFGKSPQSGLNTATAVLLALFIGAAPIPLGSNRPVFWAVSGMVLSALALIYLLFLASRRFELRHTLHRLAVIAIPFILLLAFILLQAMPLGSWVNPVNFTIGGTLISGRTLSLAPGMSLLSFTQFASYGLLFFLTLQVTFNTDRARLFLVALFVICVVYAAYSLIALFQLGDPILFMPKWAYQGSATATFVNRNSFATFLAFGLVVGIAFAMAPMLPAEQKRVQTGHIQSALLFGLGAAVIVAALAATQSRMGFTAALLGTLTTAGMIVSKAPGRKMLAWSSLGALAVFGATLILYGGGLFVRLGSFESSAGGRLQLYDQIIGMITHRPLTGFGAGGFEIAFPLFHQLPVSPDIVWDKAHSTYLSLWAELGLFFGSLPVIIVAMIALKTWKVFRSTRQRWLHAAIGLGTIVTAAIHSTADFSLEIHAVALLFTAILAVGMAGPGRISNE